MAEDDDADDKKGSDEEEEDNNWLKDSVTTMIIDGLSLLSLMRMKR